MSKSDYGYMIRKDDDFLVLIRFKNGEVETFRPKEPGEWVRTPTKDSILEGSGDWVWYDDVPEEDVEFWMDKIRKANSD